MQKTNIGKEFKMTKNADVNKIVFEMRKDKKLSFTSNLGMMIALNDAKIKGDSIFIIKKEIKTRPTNSEFLIIK